MENRKFAVGDKIHLPLTPKYRGGGGTFTVVGFLPSQTDEFAYKIRDDKATHDRVEFESQMQRVELSVTV